MYTALSALLGEATARNAAARLIEHLAGLEAKEREDFFTQCFQDFIDLRTECESLRYKLRRATEPSPEAGGRNQDEVPPLPS